MKSSAKPSNQSGRKWRGGVFPEYTKQDRGGRGVQGGVEEELPPRIPISVNDEQCKIRQPGEYDAMFIVRREEIGPA